MDELAEWPSASIPVCISTSARYTPPSFRISSSWGPSSTTSPPETTAILSASRIVERRCAITMVVMRLVRSIALIASCTVRSDAESSADVASSSTRMAGSRITARAMATRCSSD